MNEQELRLGVTALVPRLRRYAYALTGSRHDADDLLQSTVERLLTKGVPGEAALERWAFRVCRNMWIDELRSRKVRSASDIDAPGVREEETVDGESAIIGHLALGEVQRAMDTLPAEQRAVLALVALEGFSYAETAQILETPIGTVMSRLARARAALADLLRPGSLPGTTSACAGGKA